MPSGGLMTRYYISLRFFLFETDHFVFYVYRGKHKRNRCKPDISNIYLKMQWSSASSFRPYLNFSDYLHNLWVPPFARITLGSIWLLALLTIIVIFSLRTYAIYGKNWIVAVFLIIIGLGILATNIVCHNIYFKLFNLNISQWETIYTNAVALPKEFQVGPYTCFYNSPDSAARYVLLVFLSTIVSYWLTH